VNFTVLGEAAGQLSAAVKDRFPDIAWQQPTRLRNRIVHGYWSIDLEVLLITAAEQLPEFTAGLRRILSLLPTAAEAPPERSPSSKPSPSYSSPVAI